MRRSLQQRVTSFLATGQGKAAAVTAAAVASWAVLSRGNGSGNGRGGAQTGGSCLKDDHMSHAVPFE